MNSLTTIIFGEGYHRHSLDTLLKNPSSFCNVRCLSLPNVKGDGSFWQELQDGYPQLVSLTIRQYAGGDTGRYTFENLEILDISIWKSFRLSCPSLKHFAFRYGCTPPIAEFLMEHGHQLESLFLDDYALIGAEVCLKDLWMTGKDAQTMRKDIWALFPNIQTLGIAPEPLRFTLPHEHPLRNLRLLPYGRTLNTDRVLEALESLPGVARVHIQSNDLKPGTLDDLRAQCLERNVEVVAVMNGKVIEYPTVPSFVGWIAVALTCPCWAPFLFCSPFTSMRRRRR
ncbi:hypothetical protein FRC14_007273 [Serendipita sp. 396]|nr:hypothetical protein FRC14_007273 [Serendipita sp. 396]KAG8774924.1 hypothetical protein FRC15_000904 [Serendipita sp. 397]KAG8864179.1 hypothetical protein FRC20_010329 [Serendipita sp. 405]